MNCLRGYSPSEGTIGLSCHSESMNSLGGIHCSELATSKTGRQRTDLRATPATRGIGPLTGLRGPAPRPRGSECPTSPPARRRRRRSGSALASPAPKGARPWAAAPAAQRLEEHFLIEEIMGNHRKPRGSNPTPSIPHPAWGSWPSSTASPWKSRKDLSRWASVAKSCANGSRGKRSPTAWSEPN